MKLELLSALNAERAARRASVLVTELETGAQRLVKAAEAAADPLAAELASALAQGKSIGTEAGGRSWFLTVQVPPVRILVTGAVHISQALAPIARVLGFDLAIVDPRTAFATPERFPGVRLLAEWPDTALPALGGFDRYTALVALTHDPKIDDPALVAALRSDCFYIGALGSRKTHARRCERLAAAGFGEAALGRIHAPVGLPIGAISPAEIALAVMGEIIATLRKAPA